MNIQPLKRSDAADFEPVFKVTEQAMGFVPNSMLTMARDPELMMGFGMLSMRAMDIRNSKGMIRNIRPMLKMMIAKARGKGSARVSPDLRALVSMAVSYSAGCRYCQAHTATTAGHNGVTDEKLADLLLYESSPLFSDAERAALAFAFAAGEVPNAVTVEHFTKLRAFFSEEEIFDLVTVISYFGFLNRWNDTIGTMLEPEPRGFAQQRLAATWEVGKHAG